MSDITIRRAEAADLPALLEIYNYYILHTPVTFEIAPRTLDQRREWFHQFGERGRYRCFVADGNGKVIGWVSSARFKERAAYDTTVETSIYLAPDAVGQGLGRRLYRTLFEALAGEDIHLAFAGVTLPNDASVGLHEAMGFRMIGAQPQVGRKFGRFWDVAQFFKVMD
ncbi:MAG TPA: GNAT family N-acetyltransferase [Rhizomicrobium sp.]|nr:GNAT family N-acetyltransferase [Rhizomicrobium sp.]